jgi:hypothetical protein
MHQAAAAASSSSTDEPQTTRTKASGTRRWSAQLKNNSKRRLRGPRIFVLGFYRIETKRL